MNNVFLKRNICRVAATAWKGERGEQSSDHFIHISLCVFLLPFRFQFETSVNVRDLQSLLSQSFTVILVGCLLSLEMWQFLIAAAVAGSGFLARRVIFSNGDPIKEESVVKEEGEGVDGPSSERENSVVLDESIFRFSSLCGGGGRGMRKKAGLSGSSDGGKRMVAVREIGDETMVVKQQKKKKKGRKFSVCLKRRRTGKNAFGKCESCCSEGSSIFNWGIGIGIMYMVSAGKAEINKLNVAINETKEVINDLKHKLCKAKLALDLRDSSFENRVHQCAEESMGRNEQLEIIISGAEGANLAGTKVLEHQIGGDCECASSVLTEEPEPQVLEIDLLQAELESELQKISCYASEEPSDFRGGETNLGKLDQENLVDVENTKLSGGLLGSHEQISTDCNFFQSHGVSPFELDRKLCHLLVEQQESLIVELESKLQSTHIKLRDKEAELVSLKDCVRHFRDLSLETNSDEEAQELDMKQGGNSDSDLLVPSRLPFDSQKVVVGMKRAMEFEQCDYHVNNVGS